MALVRATLFPAPRLRGGRVPSEKLRWDRDFGVVVFANEENWWHRVGIFVVLLEIFGRKIVAFARLVVHSADQQGRRSLSALTF
jgi:hypothetical protein